MTPKCTKKKCSNSFIIGEVQSKITPRNHSSPFFFAHFADLQKLKNLRTCSRFWRKLRPHRLPIEIQIGAFFFFEGSLAILTKATVCLLFDLAIHLQKSTLKIHFQQCENTHVHSCIICSCKILETTLMPIRRHNMGHPCELILSDFPIRLDAKGKVQRKMLTMLTVI